MAPSNLSQQKALIRASYPDDGSHRHRHLRCVLLVRKVLLLLYISGLLAIGFSPMIRLIEKQRLLPIGDKRFPRWLAILVLYLFLIGTLVGVGMLAFPPLYEQGKARLSRPRRRC